MIFKALFFVIELATKIKVLENKDNKKDLLRYKSKKSAEDVFQNSIQKKFAMKVCYIGAKYHV